MFSLKLDMRCWMFVGHIMIFIWQRFGKKLLDRLRKVTKQPSFMFLPEICHINIIELIWTTWTTVSYHLNVFSIKDNLQGSRHSEQKWPDKIRSTSFIWLCFEYVYQNISQEWLNHIKSFCSAVGVNYSVQEEINTSTKPELESGAKIRTFNCSHSLVIVHEH